jgi:hypothetical protein
VRAIDLGVDRTHCILAAVRDCELIRASAAVSPPRNLGAREYKRTRDLALVYDAKTGSRPSLI